MAARPGQAQGWCRLTGKQERLLVAISEDGTLKATRDPQSPWTTYTLTQGDRSESHKESDVYALVKAKLVKPHPQDTAYVNVIFTPTAAGMLRASLCVGSKHRA